jgi:hypothetical protein
MKKLTKAELKTLNDLTDRAILNGQQVVSSKIVSDPKPVDQVKAVLNQRGERYGDFTDHARLAQQLQHALERHQIPSGSDVPTTCIPWNHLTSVQQRALTTICDKLARILNGDPSYDDNWIDIQGYARLVQERLPKSGTSPE